MRSRHYPSRNSTQDAMFTPENTQAKAQAVAWLMRLLNTPIVLDADFFCFSGWCVGGLKPLVRCVQENVMFLPRGKAESLKAKKAVAALSEHDEKHLADAFEELIEDYPILRDTIKQGIL